ncbi:MAG: restriction endonuclease [Candidatus Eremiobacteraeota bacterium]|nr:restriction endonuclease [Candidatus Eremiobacteraeota bacterium]
MEDFDRRFEEAVQGFWTGRRKQQEKQKSSGHVDAGSRGSVTGGGHIAPLEDLVKEVLVSCGVPGNAIFQNQGLELPGYYRAEKCWDLLVVANEKLHVAIEFKSQVGPSFGNNFNNRTEEAVGNAVDLQRALQERTLGNTVAPPFLGYVFLLEDCGAVHKRVRLSEPHFCVDHAFLAPPPSVHDRVERKNRSGVGYAKRYERLLERLLLERKYDAACLTLTTRGDPTTVTFPNEALDARHFISRLVGFASGAVRAGL